MDILNETFHSSSFALVPKKDIPLHLDGRIIHDLSAPQGRSVNDFTDTVASPDARWELFMCIARRVRELRRRYPGQAIYAMVADIAEAFKHVPVHARHASAFGGQLPRSSHGIVSGMAVFSWTSSSRFFAVYGKSPFWIFQWVDDIVLVEADIDDRLLKAEKRLRDGIKLVFGSDGWHEGKFTTWSQTFHTVGIDWDIPVQEVSIPPRKIDKLRRVVSETMSKMFVTMKDLDSLVGVLRHVVSFIPATRPFIQRLVAVQTRCRTGHKAGDLAWWKDLVFENEFAGLLMGLYEHRPAADEIWLVESGSGGILITSMVLRERMMVLLTSPMGRDAAVARGLAQVATMWGPVLEVTDAWCHVMIHSRCRWVTRVIDKMNCRSP
ncbi:hypothetical protein PHMEG_00039974, partial [Phytophthora megakarya]